MYLRHTGDPGAGFMLTPYGREWLGKVNEYECIPTEYGRFGELLARYYSRFGKGYLSRSQEALRCHRAHAYLACCIMCGAAAESILLAVAIEKRGDEREVLDLYKRATGRKKVEDLVMAQQNAQVQRELPTFMGLLKYWRDDAAHGAETNFSETEAFTSMLLLLRFAQFADERWDDLTK